MPDISPECAHTGVPQVMKLITVSGSYAVPRTDHVLETDPFFSFHHVNAYEVEGTPQVVIDTAAMDGGIDFSLSMENGSEAIYQRLSGRAVLTRLGCDLSTGKVWNKGYFLAPAASVSTRMHARSTGALHASRLMIDCQRHRGCCPIGVAGYMLCLTFRHSTFSTAEQTSWGTLNMHVVWQYLTTLMQKSVGQLHAGEVPEQWQLCLTAGHEASAGA